eukprot:1352156-Amorphochlora_amoeboformis.AAC.1
MLALTTSPHQLLPALVSLLVSRSSNTRFLSLKIVSDILLQVFKSVPSSSLSPPSSHNPRAIKQLPASSSSKSIGDMEPMRVRALVLKIIDQVLEKFDAILKDQDTITQRGLKLLNSLVDLDGPALVQRIKDHDLTHLLLEYFEAKKSNKSLHIMKLITSVAASARPPSMDTLVLCCKHSLVKGSLTLVQKALKSGKEWFYLPVLDIFYTLLLAAGSMSEDGKPVEITSKSKRVIQDQASLLTDAQAIDALMELTLVGVRPPKTNSNSKPSGTGIVHIGGVPSGIGLRPTSRAMLASGTASADRKADTASDLSNTTTTTLNPNTSANVRRLASQVIGILVEIFPSSHPKFFSTANLTRLGLALTSSTRNLTIKGGLRLVAGGDPDAHVQTSIVCAAWIMMANDSKRVQQVANFAVKCPQILRGLQEVGSAKVSSQVQKYASALAQMIGRKTPVHTRRLSNRRDRFH